MSTGRPSEDVSSLAQDLDRWAHALEVRNVTDQWPALQAVIDQMRRRADTLRATTLPESTKQAIAGPENSKPAPRGVCATYVSAGDTPYASGDRAYTGCFNCGYGRSMHGKRWAMILMNANGETERYNRGTSTRMPTRYERDRWLTRRAEERAGLLVAALVCLAFAVIVLWVAWR